MRAAVDQKITVLPVADPFVNMDITLGQFLNLHRLPSLVSQEAGHIQEPPVVAFLKTLVGVVLL
jgi:hypothetical protein